MNCDYSISTDSMHATVLQLQRLALVSDADKRDGSRQSFSPLLSDNHFPLLRHTDFQFLSPHIDSHLCYQEPATMPPISVSAQFTGSLGKYKDIALNQKDATTWPDVLKGTMTLESKDVFFIPEAEFSPDNGWIRYSGDRVVHGVLQQMGSPSLFPPILHEKAADMLFKGTAALKLDNVPNGRPLTALIPIPALGVSLLLAADLNNKFVIVLIGKDARKWSTIQPAVTVEYTKAGGEAGAFSVQLLNVESEAGHEAQVETCRIGFNIPDLPALEEQKDIRIKLAVDSLPGLLSERQ